MKKFFFLLMFSAFLTLFAYAQDNFTVTNLVTDTDGKIIADNHTVQDNATITITEIPQKTLPLVQPNSSREVKKSTLIDNLSEDICIEDEPCLITDETEQPAEITDMLAVYMINDIVCDEDRQLFVASPDNLSNILVKSKLCTDKEGVEIDGIIREMLDNSSRIVAEYSFHNGQLQGAVRQYFIDSGSLWFEYNFDNGNINGFKKIYRKDGTLEHQNSFINGIASGLSEAFYPNSKAERVSNYLDGKLNGDDIYYHPNGKVMKKLSYLNDALNGSVIFYGKDEKPFAEFIYVNDKLTNGNCFDTNGVASEVAADALKDYEKRGVIACDR